MAKRVIGLDLGKESLKAVCLKGTYPKLRLASTWIEPIEPAGDNHDAAVTAALGRLKQKFPKGRFTLVTALNAKETMLQRLTFPFADLDKIYKVVRFDVEPYIPFPIDQVFLDLQLLTTHNNNAEVLVLIAPKSSVEKKLALCKSAALIPDVVTLEGLAFTRGLALLGQTRNEPDLILDLSADKFSLHYIKGDKLLNSRCLELKPEELSSDLSRSGMELVRQINQSLQSWELIREELKPDRILLAGASAQPALRKLLTENLGVKVQQLYEEPVQLAGLAELASVDNFAQYSQALALALSGVNVANEEPVNFLKERKRSKGQATTARQIVSAGLIVLALLVFWGGADIFFRTRIKERSLNQLKHQIVQTFKRVSPKTKRVVKPLAQLKEMTTRLEKRNRLLQKLLSDRSSGLSVLRDLSELVPSELDVQLSDFLVDRDNVQISGETLNFEQVETLKKLISNSPRFTKVELLESRTPPKGNRVRFKLHLKVEEQE